MPLHPEFARTLVRQVEESGHSQERIASELGISRGTLHNWMNGKHRPSMAVAKKAAEYFGLPVSAFWLEELSPSVATRLIARYERVIGDIEDALERLRDEEATDAADMKGEIVHREGAERERGA